MSLENKICNGCNCTVNIAGVVEDTDYGHCLELGFKMPCGSEIMLFCKACTRDCLRSLVPRFSKDEILKIMHEEHEKLLLPESIKSS